MANGKYVSYLRVSTARQGASGLGLEAQREAVTTYLNGGQWVLVREVVEIESGRRNDRPALFEALLLCRLHKASLLVAKLDRLARNVHFISSLMESGVEFTACDFPKANRLTVHVLAAVAEHEAEAISNRTRGALAAAKARGTKLGGLRGTASHMRAISTAGGLASARVRTETATKRRKDVFPVMLEIRARGFVSLRSLASELNARGIMAPRGREWSAAQVKRVLDAGA